MDAMTDNAIMLGSNLLPKKILVGVDGSDESLAAARYAIELAGRLKAELSVLHVIMVPEYVSEEVSNRLKKELGSRGESAMMQVRQAAQGSDVILHEKILSTTKPVVATICDFASNNGSELIIMGSSGAGGVARLMLGAVAVGVAREAPCPVLLVR